MLLSGERSGRSLAVYVGHIIGALASLSKRSGEFARQNPNFIELGRELRLMVFCGELSDVMYAR
jgi:hypothetical protein